MTARIEPHTAEIAFWLALCAGLGAFLGEQTDWGSHLRPPLPETRYDPTVPEAPRLGEPPRFEAPDRYLEMVERPLFVVTRRPAPPPPPPAAAAPAMRKGQFRLAGVSIIGEQKIAFFLETATGKTRAVREGQPLNELTVGKVTPETVTLTLGSDSEEIPLKVVTSAQLPRTAPPPVARPPGSPQPPPTQNPPPAPAQTLGAAIQRAEQLRGNPGGVPVAIPEAPAPR